MPTLTELIDCRDRAVEGLLSHVGADGCLRASFGFRNGASDNWPSAILANLNILPPADRALALNFLRHRAVEHPVYGFGWGYNEKTPPDLDSTIEAWRALGLYPSPDIIWNIRCRRGGFATYTVADAKVLHPVLGVDGWTSSHLEITANLLRLARVVAETNRKWTEIAVIVEEDLVDHIRRFGYRAYWYHSPVVAAALALEAIGGFRADMPPIPLSSDPTQLSWEQCNNPHIMACAIEAALICDPMAYWPVVTYLAKRIIRAQRADGLWRSTLVLSVPYPDAKDARWVAHINADYGLPTITAMRVISALNRLVRYMRTLAASP